MSVVADVVEGIGDFIGGAVEAVGDAIEGVVDIAGDIVEGVGNVVSNVVEGALDDPLGTIAKVLTVATGNAWALPLVSAGTVIAHGGDLGDAVKAAGMTYAVQGIVNYANADVPGSLDYGPSIPDVVPEVDLSPGGGFSTNFDDALGKIGDVVGNFPDKIGDAFDFSGYDPANPFNIDYSDTVYGGTGDVWGSYEPPVLEPVPPPEAPYTPPEAPYTPPEAPYTPPEAPYTPPEAPYTPPEAPVEPTPMPSPDQDFPPTPIPEPVMPSPDQDFPPTPEPYDPYKDEGPSQPNPNAPVNPDPNLPPADNVEIVDKLPEWMPPGTTTIVNPDGTTGYVIGSLIYDRTGQITGTVPEIEIVDTRPEPMPSPDEDFPPTPIPPPVDDIPVIEIVDTRPEPMPSPDEDFPPTPQPPVDDIPVIEIVDTRPEPMPSPDEDFPPTPIPEPVMPSPDEDFPPTPQPPVDTPFDPTPYIPILIGNPTPTPPPPAPTPIPYTPPAPVYGNMLNPGYIQPTAFYNTTNPAQSKFYWGGHGPQFGSQFDPQAYNQVAAPNTPWGAQQVSGPLSPADYQSIIAGNYRAPAPQLAATRVEAYRAPAQLAPSYGQVQVGGPVAPTAIAPAARPSSMYTPEQIIQINTALGADWQDRQNRAALNGDYGTIADIQGQIGRALAPASTDAP